MTRKFLWGIMVCCALSMSLGCAHPSSRTHPDFDTLIKDIHSPQLVPPDVKIYELSAGGVQELRDDWCATGKDNITRAFMTSFREKEGFEMRALPSGKELEDDIEDIQALYRAVSTSILLHTYNQQHLFPEKQKRFVYSIGPIDSILNKYGADALLFVHGQDQISTGGRKALMFAGALLGVYIRGGVTSISMALVDRSGTILWYSLVGKESDFDMRNYGDCSKLVKLMIDDLPNLKR